MTSIRKWPKEVLWPVFITIGLLTGGGGMSWLMKRGPVTVIDVRDAAGLSVNDGSLDISITLIRNRTCDGYVDRWLWRYTKETDKKGKLIKRWVPLPYTTNPPTALDVEITYILSLPLPRNITEGDWFYWSRTSDNCGAFAFLKPAARESPHVPIHFKSTDLVSRAPRAPETSAPTPVRPDVLRAPL